jgi:valyl-tRNA synthetase
VAMDFGTGVVKVTPGHDPNDWEIGRRHELDVVNILNADGTLNENVPEPYRGLSVLDARKAVVRDVKAAGLYIRDQEHNHQVGHCYRCDTRIEPFLSDQWFVRMQPLAQKALDAWRRGEVKFYPQRWENTYTNWLENIRDWCISRQLWWGHRIPVWYDDETGEMIVSRTDPTEDPANAGRALRQDEDVVDTWFSSWLWPFSTLGWPDATQDLATFYPTTSLVTGYDIIFFWVARMIMAGMEFMGKAPFRDIYITGLVRDKQGRKMSKSLGNGMDPLDIVDRFGADALKFTLAFLAAKGQDILLDEEDFNFGSKFANKIWNASRYLLMNLEGRTLQPREQIELKPIDRWILHRLNEAVTEVHRAMEAYRFNDASSAGYEFFWNDFCDWYIEASKLSLYSDDDAQKDRAVSLLVYILEESLRLLHPFVSFITEEIYQKLPEFSETRSESIIVAPYPHTQDSRVAPEIARDFASLQQLVRAVRTLRSEFTIPPSRVVNIHVRTEADFVSTPFLMEHTELIRMLVTGDQISFSHGAPDGSGSIAVVGTGFEVYVFIRDAIDVDAEIARLKKAVEKTQIQLAGAEKKLANAGFLEKAGEQVVQKEREKRDELSRRIDKMTGYLAELFG